MTEVYPSLTPGRPSCWLWRSGSDLRVAIEHSFRDFDGGKQRYAKLKSFCPKGAILTVVFAFH